MNNIQAISLAIEAIRRQIKTIAVDANLHDHFQATYPFAVNCSKKRKQLLEAIKILEQLIN